MCILYSTCNIWYIYCLHPFCNWLWTSWPLTCSLFIDIALNNMFLRTLFLISHVSKKISISRFERHCNFITKFFPYMKLLFVGRCCCYASSPIWKQNFATYQSKPAFYKRQHKENSGSYSRGSDANINKQISCNKCAQIIKMLRILCHEGILLKIFHV